MISPVLQPDRDEILKFSSNFKVVAIFIAFFSFYFIAGLSGYGTDHDIYAMINSGQQVLLDYKYNPSRPPSFLIPEISIGLTSLLGSYYLSNLLSAILGSITLYIFYHLLNKIFDKAVALLTTIAVGLNPYFIIASSSSMDYIYSLFFLFCGIALLDYRKFYFTGLLFSFAICSRISIGLTIFLIYIYFFLNYYIDKEKRLLLPRLFFSSIIALLFTIVLYLPAFIASGNNFNFFTYYIPPLTTFDHISRFIYKNIYIFGLLPFSLLLVTSIYFSFKKGGKLLRNNAVLFGTGIIGVQEILFYKIPLEISYLIPLLFVIVPLWAFLINSKRILLWLLIFLTITYNIINIDLLDKKYDEANEDCIAAEIGIVIRPGILIDDLLLRKQFLEYYFPEKYLQLQAGKPKFPRPRGSARLTGLGVGR